MIQVTAMKNKRIPTDEAIERYLDCCKYFHKHNDMSHKENVDLYNTIMDKAMNGYELFNIGLCFSETIALIKRLKYDGYKISAIGQNGEYSIFFKYVS